MDVVNVTIVNKPPEILSVDGLTEIDGGTEFLLSVNFFNGFPDPRGNDSFFRYVYSNVYLG